MAATAIVKQEWTSSSSSSAANTIAPAPHREAHDHRRARSRTATVIGPEGTINFPPTGTWQPPTLHESFVRSEAPPPTVIRGGYPPPPTVRTADESEPVLMEMRARTMPGPNGVHPNGIVQNASQGDSFFDGSFRDIGAKLKACNDTLGELQQLGVNHIVSLPSLVLVGDQSAGKSSLMSGLAGLNLPRSEGVCTRCPIHIRVSRHDEWSCRVSLQLDYSFQPPPDGRIDDDDVTDENPFPPWVPQAREIKEFKTIYDSNKDDIENVLRWAQVAILNHGQNTDAFIPGTGAIPRAQALSDVAELTAAKFSPNTVALEIKGPDLPDLSFYDLPGIFQNSAREEDGYLVKVVTNLAREHISREDALIIWAVPMNADPETSSTLSIIRNMRATDRTIGVMTKADLLPSEGTHAQWLSILRGDSHTLGHEYFITSRPTDQALEDQQRWEEALFSEHGHEKWPADFVEFRPRCGVERLKAALSEKLGKAFATNLPKIKRKVQVSLKEVHKQLGNLPELPPNVEYEVRRSLLEFGQGVKNKLRGNEFSADYGKLADAFRECLLHTKPKFTMKDPSDKPVIEISDDDNESTVSTPSNRKRGAPMNTQPTPSKRARPCPPNGTPIQFGVKTEDLANGNGPSAVPPVPRKPKGLAPPFDKYNNLGTRFRTVRQVQEDIKSKMKPGMPNIVPQEVYEDLCKEAVGHWDKPMATFLQSTMLQVRTIVYRSLEDSFSKMKRRLIFSSAKSHMTAFLDDYRQMTLEFMKDIYSMETEQLFTINTEAFKLYEEEEGRTLTRYRHLMRWRAFSGESADQPFVEWSRMTPEQRSSEEKRHAAELAKLGPDPFDKEVKVAAYVRGYYRLAALRFADTITLSITSRMFPRIIARLDCYLETQLGLMGEGAFAACQSLMDEDAKTAERREMLKTTAEKLRKAEASIQELEMEAGDVDAVMVGDGVMYGGSVAPETIADSIMDEV